MGDTIITIIAIFLAGVLMFVFPLLSVSERNDDISQLAVQTATTEFVNTVKTTGVVTAETYGKLIQKINSTGNTFDVDIELKVLDENLNKKVGKANLEKIGENVYYSVYTSQVMKVLDDTSKPVDQRKYVLKEGDMVSVTVKNSNKTIAQLLKGFFYSITGNDSYQVAASASTMVTVNGK